ncbi:MAG TPA: VWA domain-containing protein [Kofleriaceae bacterium]|nr:VWA domain-containing protein [Kofleriaceae bacterium]
MSFLAPIPLGVIAWTAAVTAGLAVAAYILKMRRRRFEVPFSTLWQRVLREKEATSLWKRLRRLLSLLLTLLVLGLLLLAATEPRLGAVDRDSRSVVILLDASASMKARDGGKDGATRMDAARAAVRALLEGMGGGDAAMVMRMDGQTTPLSRFESDMPRLTSLVAKVEASDTPADLRRALGAAADALRGRPNPMIILVGDGAYDPEALASVTWKKPAAGAAGAAPVAPAAAAAADGGKRLDLIDMSGIDVRYQPVGSSGENVGIIAFNARRYATDKTSYEVYIEVQNTGKRPARRKLVLYNGDLATDVRTLELNPGERLRQIYSRGGGEDTVLRASLELEPPAGAGTPAAGPPRRDVFPLDDQAWALLPARRKQHVLLVTRDNLYLEGAMLVYDNIEVDKLTPDEFEARLAAHKLPDYAAVVFDDYTPAALPPPPTNLMYFNPQGEHSPFRLRGQVAHPHITEVNDNHPVMRWLVLNDVNFDSSSVFELDRDKGEVALASSVRDPIMAARRTADRKIVACSFSLGSTDLMLRVAFPLFLVNTIDWFASDEADLLTTYATGTRARVPLDGVLGVSEVTVTAPSKRVSRAPLVEGQATFYASEVGVHVLRALDRPAGRAAGRVLAEVSLAANLSSPTESNITPAPRLELGGAVLAAPEGFGISHPRSIWMYLILLAAALLCAEWLTFNRRITV